MSLTYSINYTPEYKARSFVSFMCSDNRIHLRFKNFEKEEEIKGFEKKLVYLMTYLFNYSYMPNIVCNTTYDNYQLISNFLNTDDIKDIILYIKLNGNGYFEKFKGFKIKVNYKKSNLSLPFGKLDDNCFPLNRENQILLKGSLDIFLSTLKINLWDYLFNDGYSINILKVKNQKFNDKFINKELKKYNKVNQNLVELW